MSRLPGLGDRTAEQDQRLYREVLVHSEERFCLAVLNIQTAAMRVREQAEIVLAWMGRIPGMWALVCRERQARVRRAANLEIQRARDQVGVYGHLETVQLYRLEIPGHEYAAFFRDVRMHNGGPIPSTDTTVARCTVRGCNMLLVERRCLHEECPGPL
jgi:hypothetical protein